jgi:exonuclease SbcC
MRPVKLVLSAFGSYAGEQEITFDENGEKLFLITGDTGAGKTTIFDAICFAFYGEMSGENREGKMMRSDYAKEDQKTYVDFIFEDKGNFYRIIRNPEYTRKSKRKKKMEDGTFVYSFVKEMAKAELFFLDAPKSGTKQGEIEITLSGQAFQGNMRETNAKIVEIIGLDQNQFTQIAMIAQGEFMKLLVSSTDQKKEIFQKLFQTQKYQKIVKKMLERKKEKETERAKNKTECEIILADTDCREESSHKEAFECCKKEYFLHSEEFLEILELIIKEDGETVSDIKKELNIKKEERDALLLEIQKIEQINSLWKSLEEAEQSAEKWKEKEKESKEKEKRLEQAEKAEKAEEKRAASQEARRKEENRKAEIEERKKSIEKLRKRKEENEKKLLCAKQEKEENEERLNNEILEIESNLPKYDEIEKIRKERKEQEKYQKTCWQKLEKLEKTIEEQEKNRLLWAQEQIEMEEKIKELPEKKNLLIRTEEKLIQYEELEKKAGSLKELLEKKEKSGKLLKKREEDFQKKSRLYEEMVIRFTNGQAGIMAQELKEGKPCPVCGNTHYIHLAPLEEDMPTQAEVKKAKEKRDEAEENMQSTTQEAMQDKLSYEKQYALCKETCGRLTGEKIALSADGENLWEITKIISELKQESRQLRQEKQELEKLEEEKEDHKRKIEETKKDQEEEKKKKEELEEKTREAEHKVLELKTKEEIHAVDLVFQDKRQADEKLRQKKERREAIISNYQKLLEEQTKQEHELLKKKTEMETMQREWELFVVERKKKEEIYQNALKEQGFSSEEEWLLARADEKQKKAWKREIEQVKKEVISSGQSVIELKKQLGGKEKQEESIPKKMLAKKKEEIEMLSEQQQSMEFRQKKNQEAWEKLKQKRESWEILEQDYRQIKNLYEVANGTLAGAVKVDLETFVQRQYLKQVLRAANKRFLKMSKGQFELRLKDGKNFDQKSNQGLDLSVYSYFTNTDRDIKTLSGGESFMAALSMALGMADIIQGAAGAVRLDMMFIDEGFGALDEQSRQQAVNVLRELSDGKRMIGIISHVTELKEQVNRKLVVEKSGEGSKAHWE